MGFGEHYRRRNQRDCWVCSLSKYVVSVLYFISFITVFFPAEKMRLLFQEGFKGASLLF